MFVGLNEKEKKLFDTLIEDIGIRDALNILTEYALLKGDKITVVEGSLIKVKDEDDEDDGEEEVLKIPKDMKAKEPTDMKPIPSYDSKIVLESRISGYV